MERISEEKAAALLTLLIKNWDISKHYWFPLYDCKRDDVIAFKVDYIEDDTDKIQCIRDILQKQGDEKILEMHEDRSIRVIQTSSFDPYYGGSEGEKFWFTEKMSWIIYVSHEGSITFGGADLIKALKAEWIDWEENLFS